jgi:hypothetical protein
MSLQNKILQNAKNLIGTKTDRKIVVFDVDDYGNVRVGSKRAIQNLEKAGFSPRSRYDYYDTLETNDDLHALFDVLRSVKDRNGRSAIFTLYALPANINFEAMLENGFQEYVYELLPETLNKLGPDYDQVEESLKQGMREGLIHPEFHGREHFHVPLLMEKLKRKDACALACFENRSLMCLNSEPYRNVKWTSAFDFEKLEDNKHHEATIADGIAAFSRVFGVSPVVFCAPGSSNHRSLFEVACHHGIRYVETAMIQKEHQGEGRYKKLFNYTGKRTLGGGRMIIRNCVFEPTEERSFDWVAHAIGQIQAAFRWGRPAVVSSHRVNFCGLIDGKNRDRGLAQLKELLNRIVETWPDVEFMSTGEMAKVVGI